MKKGKYTSKCGFKETRRDYATYVTVMMEGSIHMRMEIIEEKKILLKKFIA